MRWQCCELSACRTHADIQLPFEPLLPHPVVCQACALLLAQTQLFVQTVVHIVNLHTDTHEWVGGDYVLGTSPQHPREARHSENSFWRVRR